MKNFGKTMQKEGAPFQDLYALFSALSSAKLKDGIFVGPQIQEVLKDKEFEKILTLEEGKHLSKSAITSLVTYKHQITKNVLSL